MEMLVQNRVFMAPMAGITDMPMRKIIHQICGKDVVQITEMVSVNALDYNNKKTCQIADVRTEPYPVTVQLMGAEPMLFARAAKTVEALGAARIDINMGCPVRKIISSKAGAFLMTDLKTAAQIIEQTVRATNLPVSVKFRTGWDLQHINAVEFAQMCEKSGAKLITVHGRTKVQGYSGKADWSVIQAVKNAVKIPVVANGDITSAQTAEECLKQTGADAVMVGRAALGTPWLLKNIAAYLSRHTLLPEPSVSEVYQTLKQHISYLIEYYGERVALGLSRKYICWYGKSLRDVKRFREEYMHILNMEEACQAIDTYFLNLLKEQEL